MKHRFHLLVLTLSLMTAVSVQAPKETRSGTKDFFERTSRIRVLGNKIARKRRQEQRRERQKANRSHWSDADFAIARDLARARSQEYAKMEEVLPGDASYESALDLRLSRAINDKYLRDLLKEQYLARSSFEREKRARFDKILEQVQRINLLILCYRGTSKEVHRAMVERARKKLEHMIFSDEVLSDSYTVSA